MKIKLLEPAGGFPAGSVHRVIGTYPAESSYGEPWYHLIEGCVVVRPSRCWVVPEETYAGDPIMLGIRQELDALLAQAKAHQERLNTTVADLDSSMREPWTAERDTLIKERDRLVAENIDLKNRLADLRHEQEMDRWLR